MLVERPHAYAIKGYVLSSPEIVLLHNTVNKLRQRFECV